MIPNELKKYWFRGYLDGDGCIKLGKKYGVEIVFAGSYEQDWGFMVNLCEEIKINFSIDKRIVEKGRYSHFRINKKNDVKKISDYIYSNYDNIGFDRKYKKYLDVVSYIENKEKLFWSEKDVIFLINNYKLIGGKKCSEFLKKDLNSVYNKIRLLKQKKRNMISVVCSSQYPLDEFKEHVIKTSGLHNKIEFLGYENKGKFSLTEIYNRGLRDSKYDIVVYMHHDLTVETKQWGNKLIKLFDKNPNFGVIGVAGTKNMPETGRWWDNPNKMYGRVQHTHEGKTWLSSYSEDLGHELENVVLVDGLFFAVHKNRIVKEFNEEVEGFHFYEITFCVENYLKQVSIGVTTTIRVNHQSIGMTNEQWETNRQEFVERFKDVLPINVSGVRQGKKLKIQLVSSTLNQNGVQDQTLVLLAGSLQKLGHDVTITSVIGGPLVQQAKKSNVKLFSLHEPPGFRLGDGKWEFPTQNGLQPSIEKTLYQLKPVKFDIIHVFNNEIIDLFKNIYPDVSLINTVFSDGLFVNSEPNDKVNTTITLKTKLDGLNVSNIVDKYFEVL